MPSVLLIDRDPPSVKLARLVLEDAGWNVITASSVEVALDLVARVRPLLVVTDLVPPDPFAAITNLRRVLRDTPIVAVTSLDGPSIELGALSAGCDGYLRKPIDVSTFASQLRTFIKERT